jgi:hypothetical protein
MARRVGQSFGHVFPLNEVRVRGILSRLREDIGTAGENDNLLTIIRSLCQNPASLQKLSFAGIRRQSRVPHQLSAVNKIILHSLDGILDDNRVRGLTTGPKAAPQSADGPHLQNAVTRDFPSASSCFRSRPKSTKAILPFLLSLVQPTQPRGMDGAQRSMAKHSTVMVESLETLFTTECLLLTAYLEAVIPFFYCSYMRVMVHLHNAHYHAKMKGVTRANIGATILPVFVFGLLQIASFLLLLMLIKRNCAMRGVYQLAFVLESQGSLIRCKMMLWMVITLCFRVVHFGKQIGCGAGALETNRFCFLLPAQVLTSGLNSFGSDFQRLGHHQHNNLSPWCSTVMLEEMKPVKIVFVFCASSSMQAFTSLFQLLRSVTYKAL